MYTYLVEGAGMIKIGRSGDPRKRLPDLQIGSPVTLDVFAICHGDIERHLHAVCDEHRAHGEWFDGAGVRATLRIALKRAQVYGVCLGASLFKTAESTRRDLLIMRAPVIRFRPCERPDKECGPVCWFTDDGCVFTDWYGDVAGRRSLTSAARLGVLDRGGVVDLLEGNRTPLPTSDLDALRRWIPGCLRCSVESGRTFISYDVARAVVYGSSPWVANDEVVVRCIERTRRGRAA